MKKIFVFVFTITLALSCSGQGGFIQHDTPPHLSGSDGDSGGDKPDVPSEGKPLTIRLCSYNVGTFSKSKEELGHYSYQEAADVLNELEVDVVGLNETDKNNDRTDRHYQAEKLAECLGKGWTDYFASAANIFYGNSVVASPDFKVVKEWPRLEIPKGDGAEVRSMGAVEYEDFVFCVTHLDHMSGEARKKGVEVITAWALENYGKGKTLKPVFLTGDMNCIPVDAPISAFKKNWTLISANEPTFPGKKTCIDYIFVLNNGVKVTPGETHAVSDKEGIGLVSDHYPIYCDVTFDTYD